jgi:DNA (cytosine-5)-methyltransferase 1
MFSGIGAPEVAMPWVDWAWCAEIEKFPSSVLAYRQPHSNNLGDVTAPDFISRAKSQDDIGLLVAGSPCQAFSIAGFRRSLDDARGNLTLRLVEVVHAINPRFLLWENVPGVLSTKDNAFGCFLAGLVGADAPLIPPDGHPRWRNDGGGAGWFAWPDSGMVIGPERTAAWRILDAQYCRLAQRRERVFVVSGRVGDAVYPGSILFEPESLRRDYPPSRKAKEGTASGFEVGPSGGRVTGLCPTLDARCKDSAIRNQIGLLLFAGNNQSGAIDIATACRAKGGTGHGDFESETFVTGTLTANGKAAGSATQQDAETGMLVAHVVGTLPSGGSPNGHGTTGVNDQAVMAGHIIPVAYRTNAGGQLNEQGEVAAALTSMSDPTGQFIAFTCKDDGGDASEVSPTLRAMGGDCGGGSEFLIEHSLRGEGHDASEDGTGRGVPIIPVAFTCKDDGGDASEVSPTLRAMPHDGSHANAGGQVAVVFQESQTGCREYDSAGSLRANGPGHDPVGTRVREGSAVRRLTPRECERLQGFPDDYTLIPTARKRQKEKGDAAARLATYYHLTENGRAAVELRDGRVYSTPDGPRYKALGNSMAVDVIRWLGERIRKATTA